jgi:hypothetical protein|tara:strand:+ start:7415 stop:7687 length:273 start_codon:yes stop_codon:yes gene_type:complete
MSDDGNRYDDDKIIDITDYVSKKNKQSNNDNDITMEKLNSHFMSIINKNIIDRQKKAAKESFIYFMINFLLLSQLAVVVAISIILLKLYA